jgi:hypothetical protein
MRRIVLAVLAAAVLAAGAAPAAGSPATACASGYRAVTLRGEPACLKRNAACFPKRVLHRQALWRRCVKPPRIRPDQSTARR